ncbi:MAG TPA: lipopolysaccharide kinase InaA family protein [Tepidisphaeraceae bacterium]|nr:lipopolysaccharide kinase InaA family protein [Tepidisphaeraceae bacterium]
MDRAWKSGDGVQQLLKRERALVARVRVDDGGSVIAKLWCSPGIRALLRRKTRTSNCHAEWKVMNFLHEVGASVPRPLGHCVLVSGPYTEGLLIEDLGECVPGLSHVKTLLRAGREAEHERFIDRIIEMTELMVRHGVIDPDHGLHNILVCSDGRPVRIDFEVARVVRGPIGQRSIYGEMIGRLLTSYVFAAQPDTSRIEKFAKRLEKRLNPPAAVLQRAAKYVQEQLAKQSATMGVHTQVQLDW